jgi:chromosome segregation ATPase
MTKVYQSLRGVVQGTLPWSKAGSTVSAPLNGDSTSLNDAMEELEKTVGDGIARLKSAVSAREAVAAGEALRTDQLIESLRANIAALETKLKEMEDTVHKKDLASQKMEETLGTQIRDLQTAVSEKEEALESRSSEVNDLKSKIDDLVKQLTQMESAIQQAKEAAAAEAQRAENLSETSNAKIATLEAQLRQAEQIVRGKDWTLKELEQRVSVKIQDLESQLTHKEKLLADRDKQVTDLGSELKRLKTGIKEMSSFFRQAEAFDTQPQDIGPVAAGEQLKKAEEKPPTPQVQDVRVTSNVKKTGRETLSQDTFERMIADFAELTNVIKPLASVIIRDHVKSLGESMEKFPKARLKELLDRLTQDMPNESVKTSFRERLGKL